MKGKKVIVTGGLGYIGSHTIVDLLEKGFEVISIDNLSRSNPKCLEGISAITGKVIRNYKVDLCNLPELKKVIAENKDAVGIIHFAAFKDIVESVREPLLYYHNNISSTVNILKCALDFNIKHFIFSSSCTVYGNIESLPVSEITPLGKPACPYALTKQMGEKIIRDVSVKSDLHSVMLRYFNPAGAHLSGKIGEHLFEKGNNLVPIINQVASGIRPSLVINGNEYPTSDGTALRDFIHVMDIAEAHTLALIKSLNGEFEEKVEVFNLGMGKGITVLEAIKCFEEVNNVKLNYTIGPRRDGDIIAIYADNKKARLKLNWETRLTLKDIMRSAWVWQQKSVSNN